MKSLKNAIKTSAALILFAGALSMSSCKKTALSPTSTGSHASFALMSSSSPASGVAAVDPNARVRAAVAASAPLITWTAGSANITRFEFEAKRNGVETSFETRNLSNVDLFALSPALASISIDSGTYKEIEVRLVLSQSATAAIPLTLMGTFTTPQDSVAVPVEFDFNQDLKLKAEAENVVISKTQNLKTLFMLNLNMISTGLSAADLHAATRTNGKVVISSTSNTALFNKIVSNLQSISQAKCKSEDKGSDDGGDSHGGKH
ncbi:MAG: hypothetical protein M3N14_07425 [Bacteroidota bacterium]|nr:hypothetical protein [Bacteroidota bacterium]